MVKGISRKFFLKTDGKKFQTGNAYALTERNDYSCLCMWTISQWQERNKIWNQCGKLMNEVDLGEPTSFLDHVHVGCTQRERKKTKILWTITEICLNPGCQLEELENCFFQKNPKRTFHLGLLIWKVMQRNAWKDIANLQTKKLNSCTKSQLHVLTTINSKKKK